MENISEKDLKKEEIIYKWSNVDVFKAKIIKTGQPIVVKKLKINSVEEINYIQKESYTTISLQHPNIAKLLARFLSGNGTSIEHVFFVTDYYPRGDLSREINRRSVESYFWSENELLYHFKSLIDAHCWLQNRGIAHRNIKPENILVSDKGDLLVADLGCAYKRTPINKDNLEFAISRIPVYLSPKLKEEFNKFNGEDINYAAEHDPIKSDVYSLGLIFLYMASLRDLSDLIFLRNFEINARERIKEIGYSSTIKDLIEDMLIFDENLRPDFVSLSNRLASMSGNIAIQNKIQNAAQSDSWVFTFNPNVQENRSKSTRIKVNQRRDINNFLRKKFIKIWVKNSYINNYMSRFLNSIITQTPIASEFSNFLNLARSMNFYIKVSSLSYKCIFCNLDNCDAIFSCGHYGHFHKQCIDQNYIYHIDSEKTRQYQINCGLCDQPTVLYIVSLYLPQKINHSEDIFFTNQINVAHQSDNQCTEADYFKDKVRKEKCQRCCETKTVLFYPSCRHKSCGECIKKLHREHIDICSICPMGCESRLNLRFLEYLDSLKS